MLLRVLTVNSTTLLVLAVIFLATFIRSAFGFGEALVAVPLLALLMPVEAAAPLAVLVSITVAAIAIAQDWRHIHVRSAGSLLLATLVGTPIGLLLLTRVPEHAVKAILGAVIVAFSIYSLLSRNQLHLRNDRSAWIFGFIAGILGGAYGMNGPPLVVYGGLRRWSPQHFRATLQGYFLPASIAVLIGYSITGLWTRNVTHDYVLTLPAVLIATLLGRAANHRMSGRSFFVYIYVGLILIGATLLVQALRR
jgi:uncharacterized membrane protein YfcA